MNPLASLYQAGMPTAQPGGNGLGALGGLLGGGSPMGQQAMGLLAQGAPQQLAGGGAMPRPGMGGGSMGPPPQMQLPSPQIQGQIPPNFANVLQMLRQRLMQQGGGAGAGAGQISPLTLMMALGGNRPGY